MAEEDSAVKLLQAMVDSDGTLPTPPQEVPEEGEKIVQAIAKTGSIPYQWSLLKPLLKRKTANVLGTFFGQKGFVGPVYDSFESRQAEILTLFDRFEDEPPFTIQRLAEILVQAHQEYKTTHALLNGIEKLLSVHTSASDYEEYMSAAVDSCI